MGACTLGTRQVVSLQPAKRIVERPYLHLLAGDTLRTPVSSLSCRDSLTLCITIPAFTPFASMNATCSSTGPSFLKYHA